MASTSVPDQFALPNEEALRQAGELQLVDEQGNNVPFHRLYAPRGDRHLIVFIRHFFCGHCEDYVRVLSTQLSPSTLSAIPANVKIIGCGQVSNVADYKKRTNCAFPIYCDPSRALYAKLNMVSNLELGDKRPEYVSSSITGGTLSSMANMIMSGTKVFGGGDFKQNGGEWVFDEKGQLLWCHRMRNTRDHAEIEEVIKALRAGNDKA